MEWIQANWAQLTTIFLLIVRLIESVMVVLKNEKALTIIKVIKEFFKIS